MANAGGKYEVTAQAGKVTISWASAEMVLSAAEAAELGRALLAASGEKRLPQSRQIGGIIGPY